MDNTGHIVQIQKSKSGKHIIKGVVYKPDEEDSQGDWMSADDIEEMAYLFMRRSAMNSIDTKHTFDYIHGYVCESYIVREDDPDKYPVGAWVVAIKIEDEEIWAGIENGDFEGLSMAGIAFSHDD